MIRTYADEPLPPVAILRGGTMNTIARSFGIFGDARELTLELVDRHRRGELASIPWFEREILQVGDAYGFIFGNGIIYNFLHEYYATGNPSPATAAQLIMRAAGSTMVRGPLAQRIYKRFHARVVADGDRWACEDFITVAAAVVEQIGLGFKPFYRVGERSRGPDDGGASDAFALLGIHTDAIGFVAELPSILAGRPMRRDKVIDQAARHVVFEADDPLEYIIDGDTYVQAPGQGGTLTLRVGPKLRFLRCNVV
jgi:diacylglycerol kinase family enzyme